MGDREVDTKISINILKLNFFSFLALSESLPNHSHLQTPSLTLLSFSVFPFFFCLLQKRDSKTSCLRLSCKATPQLTHSHTHACKFLSPVLSDTCCRALSQSEGRGQLCCGMIKSGPCSGEITSVDSSLCLCSSLLALTQTQER